ncbi:MULTISPECIES: serine protease [Nostoc]|uniref:Tetratricopeptide repeat protein n=2 Tax=Nostoc TaxID=1177 RepID=A0ABR8IC44_9NOSO|nr:MULTISPECIES: serine protease [Nostoc]MBD2563125.1 tetratricopeptide repeat protein [Nostoc linckia FACHB-391]MBD2648454.1 tetratricopeptide repeat protein [Nostoc foliaceum FACHB-393]
MNFTRSLSAILVGAAVVLLKPQVALSLTPVEVNNIAQTVTVRIDGDGVGSGVIFERKGETYFVLTNRHVVSRDGRYEIHTQDGGKYPVYYSKELPGLDLAVLQFNSNKSYPIANLGNSDQIREGMTVYVVGWADRLPGIDERSYQFTNGNIRSRLKNPDEGYALVYNNEALPGMSGGPVLDENGRLVGINGRATQPEEKTGTVLRLGIPINTFLAARNNVQPVTASSPTPAPKPGVKPNIATAGQSNTTEKPAPKRQQNAEDFISLGGAKADKGDYKGAIANYNQALQINSNNPDAYFRRGAAYNELKDYPAAFKDFEQVIRLTPKNAIAYAYRGFVRAQLKDYQGSLADADKAISLNNDPKSRTSALSYAVRGTANFGLNDYQQAIADIGQVIQRLPNQPEPYGLRGIVRTVLKDYKLAIADYNKALSFFEFSGIGIRLNNEQNQGLIIEQVNDDSPASKVGVKVGDRILAIDGKPTIKMKVEDATKLIRGEEGSTITLRIKRQGRSDFDLKVNRILISDPKAAEIYQNRAIARVGLEDKQGAIADLQKAADLYQRQGKTAESQTVLNSLRELQNIPSTSQPPTPSNQAEPQTIIATANEAIVRNPKDANAYTRRASGRYQQGDKQKALEDLNQATRFNPKHSLAWFFRGGVLQELGRNEEAVTSYNRAIEANSEWGKSSVADVYFSRANLYSDSGDYRRAIADYNQVLRLNPKNASAYALRGLNHQRRGDNQAAIKDFNSAVQIDPNNAVAYFARGISYHFQGDYQGALAAYEKATVQDAKLIAAVNNLGLIKYELQDIEGAIRQFQASIKIDSKSAEPQLALATALYVKGDREQALELAQAALRLDKRFADLDVLKKNLWGDRILADVQKLLQNPQIRALPSRR